MANEEHLKMLRQGVAAWNDWREKNPEVVEPDLRGVNLTGMDLHLADLRRAALGEANLRGTDLSRANLSQSNLRRAYLFESNLRGTDLSRADLRGGYLRWANLREAQLMEADLFEADFRGADLSKANLFRANLRGVNLRKVNLREAHLRMADLSEAHLSEADLRRADFYEAHLSGANLRRADLREANLCGADLRGAQLIRTDLGNAALTGSRVYGVSVWNVNVDEDTKQQNLIITAHGEPVITVDNIEVAQFIHLLLNNQAIRKVIDTITCKAVLILGRFSKERKSVLDALRDELRKHNYLPILFDFPPSANQATLETIKTLASMARFVVADLTDARSVLMELGAIVPAFPSVAVRLLIKKSAHEYGMLDYIRAYKSVVENTYEYEDEKEVIASIKENIIAPVEAKVEELRRLIRLAAR